MGKYKNWQECLNHGVEKSLVGVRVPMRDQVSLVTNIYLPRYSSKTLPVILIRSPYVEGVVLDEFCDYASEFLANGLGIVFQYERGCFGSGGEYGFLSRAVDDGLDTLDWIASQDWSNGKVGTFGCSSTAENQLALATVGHPSHAAAIVQAPGAAIGRIGPFCERGNIYRGGVLQLFFASWFDQLHIDQSKSLQPIENTGLAKKEQPQQYDLDYYSALPVCEINQYKTPWSVFSTRSPADPEWAHMDYLNEGDQISVPVLWVFSWFDIAIAPNLLMYKDACKHSQGRGKHNQHLIVAAGTHCKFGKESEQTYIGDRYVGDARYHYSQHFTYWFNHWLQDKAEDKSNSSYHFQKISYYQLGDNQWRFSNRLPYANTESRTLFLGRKQGSSHLKPGGVLSESRSASLGCDSFFYDPKNPVPTCGGGACCMGDIKAEGSYDQRDIEKRQDVLIYTSAALENDFSVTGLVEVTLFVSSSAPDTDITLKLVDAYPDGRAFNVDDTILRLRYRNGYTAPEPMIADKVYAVKFPPMAIGNTFKRGHSIRLEVSSSNFPRYERNLNTGGANYSETEGIGSTNSIYFSEDYQSRIVFI